MRATSHYLSATKNILSKIRGAVNGSGRIAYSQEGEDLILQRFFADQPHGYYVDVGAYHPIQISNTYYFYLQGWSGINIDPNPGTIELFNKYRKRDVNVHAAVGTDQANVQYYQFEYGKEAINTCDQDLANQYVQQGYQVRRIDTVQTQSLQTILTKQMRPGQDIDFMTIDIEGYELAALQSNDWRQFRPRLVLVECLGEEGRLTQNFQQLQTDPAFVFLTLIGYQCVAKTYNTVFFQDQLAAPRT